MPSGHRPRRPWSPLVEHPCPLAVPGNINSSRPGSAVAAVIRKFEAEPAFQRSVQSTGKRSSPDVLFDGDPDTGVSVYETSLQTGHGSWQVVGGTSLGTPAWAGIIAIVDQGRAVEGEGSLNGATQTLPTTLCPTVERFSPGFLVRSAGLVDVGRHRQHGHRPRNTERAAS